MKWVPQRNGGQACAGIKMNRAKASVEAHMLEKWKYCSRGGKIDSCFCVSGRTRHEKQMLQHIYSSSAHPAKGNSFWRLVMNASARIPASLTRVLAKGS